jgi:hypothetical protein
LSISLTFGDIESEIAFLPELNVDTNTTGEQITISTGEGKGWCEFSAYPTPIGAEQTGVD